jgi:hypothetical protein
MAEQKSTANQRLTQIKDFLTMNKTATTIPWDPDCTKFPTRKELVDIPGAPKEAAWVWGDNDNVGFAYSASQGRTDLRRSLEGSTFLLPLELRPLRKRSGLARSFL